jgi:hypothetical protein
MKSKKHKKLVLIIFGFFVIITMSIALFNTRAQPDRDALGCHPGGYTISTDVSEIEAEVSGNYTVEVIGTGTSVVVDVYAGAKDNDLFNILPSNIIADNSPDDLDPAVNSIRVNLNITVPSQDGIYTLRILVRSPLLDGEDTAINIVDIEVTVGTVIVPPTPPLALFFSHSNYYIGLTVVILLVIGLIVFQVNMKKRSDIEEKNESKLHGIFMTSAFIITTINAFLILNEAMNSTFGPTELPIINYVSQLSHIILGSIGYIAGIVAVFGTFTNVPISKMKIPVYIMFSAWTFNFFYGIFVPLLGG